MELIENICWKSIDLIRSIGTFKFTLFILIYCLSQIQIQTFIIGVMQNAHTYTRIIEYRLQWPNGLATIVIMTLFSMSISHAFLIDAMNLLSWIKIERIKKKKKAREKGRECDCLQMLVVIHKKWLWVHRFLMMQKSSHSNCLFCFAFVCFFPFLSKLKWQNIFDEKNEGFEFPKISHS